VVREAIERRCREGGTLDLVGMTGKLLSISRDSTWPTSSPAETAKSTA
jgi:hypothetical protein